MSYKTIDVDVTIGEFVDFENDINEFIELEEPQSFVSAFFLTISGLNIVSSFIELIRMITILILAKML